MFDHTDPILIHNVDILSNVDLREFYQIASQSEKGKVKSEESECGSEKGKVENEDGRGKNEELNSLHAE